MYITYSDFQSYKVHPRSLPASDEGVGGGVLVPGLMTICCKTTQDEAKRRQIIFLLDYHQEYIPLCEIYPDTIQIPTKILKILKSWTS
jgi:hypothetical protein